MSRIGAESELTGDGDDRGQWKDGVEA